jgi:hypothetical protein
MSHSQDSSLNPKHPDVLRSAARYKLNSSRDAAVRIDSKKRHHLGAVKGSCEVISILFDHRRRGWDVMGVDGQMGFRLNLGNRSVLDRSGQYPNSTPPAFP